MEQGLVWSKGVGRLSPGVQRDRMQDVGVNDRNIHEDWADLAPLRRGDVVFATTPMPLASSPLDLVERYANAMESGASVVIDGHDPFDAWPRLPDLFRLWARKRGQARTDAARKAPRKRSKTLKRPHSREEVRQFSVFWRDPNETAASIARRYGVAESTIWRWRDKFKLGDKARPEKL